MHKKLDNVNSSGGSANYIGRRIYGIWLPTRNTREEVCRGQEMGSR